MKIKLGAVFQLKKECIINDSWHWNNLNLANLKHKMLLVFQFKKATMQDFSKLCNIVVMIRSLEELKTKNKDA